MINNLALNEEPIIQYVDSEGKPDDVGVIHVTKDNIAKLNLYLNRKDSRKDHWNKYFKIIDINYFNDFDEVLFNTKGKNKVTWDEKISLIYVNNKVEVHNGLIEYLSYKNLTTRSDNKITSMVTIPTNFSSNLMENKKISRIGVYVKTSNPKIISLWKRYCSSQGYDYLATKDNRVNNYEYLAQIADNIVVWNGEIRFEHLLGSGITSVGNKFHIAPPTLSISLSQSPYESVFCKISHGYYINSTNFLFELDVGTKDEAEKTLEAMYLASSLVEYPDRRISETNSKARLQESDRRISLEESDSHPTYKNKIAVVTAATKDLNIYTQHSFKINEAYANKHDYAWHADIYDNLNGKHGGWLKIKTILKYLRFYEVVMWIDADAIFVNDDKKVEEFLRPGKDFYICTEAGVSYNLFNSGIMIFRHCDFTFNLLTTTLRFKESFFGMLGSHEQACLIYFYLNNIDDAKKHTQVLKPYEMNTVMPNWSKSLNEGDYILHLMGCNNLKRSTIFSLFRYFKAL
jgi:hypothetical protein